MEEFSKTWQGRAQNSILQIYDLRSKETKVVARLPQVIEAPMWAKDGEALIYNSKGRLYRCDIASGRISPVPTGAAIACNNDHVLAPDGSAVAVSGNVEDSLVSKIYIYDFAAGTLLEVVSKPWSYLHGWSPDMRTLAYCAGRPVGDSVEWDVYTCPAAGGEEKRLTDAPGLNDGPEYSADGKTIWFNSVRSGLMQVYKMNADGSGQIQMTFDEDRNSWFPHISPDMQKVVYLAYRKGDLEPGEHLPDKQVEIRLIPACGGKPETLLRLFGGQGSINVNSWAPDSARFAFVSYEAQQANV